MLEFFLEALGPWIIGVIFFVGGIWAILTAPSSENPFFTAAFGLLALYTAVVSLLGLGLKRATKPLLLSWFIFLLGFLAFAALFHFLWT